MDEKKEITTEDREELEYPLVIPEEKESIQKAGSSTGRIPPAGVYNAA